MEEEKRIIEVNGVKLEVDMRYATRIDTFKIGSFVKVLRVSSYENSVYPGVVVGYEPFQNHPTIIVAYLTRGYGDKEIQFLSYNEGTEGYEIVLADPNDLSFECSSVLEMFDNKINKLEMEIQELKVRKEFFIRQFGHYVNKVMEEK